MDDLTATSLPASDVREPFATFYGRSYARAIRFAVLLGASRSEADDLAQDAFARMCRRWDDIDSPDHYLDASIRNSWRTVHRRRRKGHGVTEPLHPSQERGAASVWDLATDIDLARAVVRLPVKHREVVVLRYYLDLSEREIADVIGRPAGTVKSRLSRALDELMRSVDRG